MTMNNANNISGLKRFITIYNGMLFFGVKNHTIHNEHSERTFVIECSKANASNKLILTEIESRVLMEELKKALGESF